MTRRAGCTGSNNDEARSSFFFGLGDFERAMTKVGPTEVGVVTQRGVVDQAKFALDSSVGGL